VILLVAASVFVLLFERLRLLVLMAPIVSAPALFMAAQTRADLPGAGAVLWPAMLASVAILVHVAACLIAPRLRPLMPRHHALLRRWRTDGPSVIADASDV